jgi:phage shock protein PspC (stress-responsive transcriptional regulator)
MQYQRQYYREKYANQTHEKTINGNTLTKDTYHKKISGVCAGIANHYHYPRWGIRIAAIVALFSFPVLTIIAYIVASLVIPAH